MKIAINIKAVRDEIMAAHQGITVTDIPNLYDTSIFNLCAEEGCLAKTLDIWQGIHPSIITLEMQWKYEMPLGIIYPKKPTKALSKFIAGIKEILNSYKNAINCLSQDF